MICCYFLPRATLWPLKYYRIFPPDQQCKGASNTLQFDKFCMLTILCFTCSWMQLEFEPEYAMESFGKNPDIDEKPPISLREFLLKMKPLLVATEGIENEEEWKVCAFFCSSLFVILYLYCI